MFTMKADEWLVKNLAISKRKVEEIKKKKEKTKKKWKKFQS